MSANIYINQFGRASMFSAREVPWHGLGQIVDGALTSEEAIKAADLDYLVETAPVYASIGGGLTNQEARETDNVIKTQQKKMDGEGYIPRYHEATEVPNQFATYRVDTGKAFGIVGSRYTVVQNHEAFSFFDSIVGKGEAMFETAGALGDGETIFITAKLPDHISVPGGAIDKYLIFTNRHDGKGSIIAGFTPVRIVCANTLHMALKDISHEIRIRHTASAADKLKEAGRVMGLTNQLSKEMEEIYTHLYKQPIVDKDVKEFFTKLLYDKERYEERRFESSQINNVINKMERFYHIGVGQAEIIGTKYGVYNAVSGYYQNVKTSSNTKKMLESNIFGNNAKVVSRSLNMLLNETN